MLLNATDFGCLDFKKKFFQAKSSFQWKEFLKFETLKFKDDGFSFFMLEKRFCCGLQSNWQHWKETETISQWKVEASETEENHIFHWNYWKLASGVGSGDGLPNIDIDR